MRPGPTRAQHVAMSTSRPAPSRDRGSAVALLSPRPSLPLDVGMALGMTAIGATARVGRRVRALTSPLVEVVSHSPSAPGPVHPRRMLGRLSRRGRRQREDLLHSAGQLLDRAVPMLVDEVVRRLDLTSIVRRYVDLDVVVSDVDLDAAVSRLDVDAVAGRLDVAAVVERIDLTSIVRENLDLDGIVGLVDLDAAVARVDLDAAVARVDLDAVVARIDVTGLAEDVIATLDLPEIIRESTGAVSSETVREVRMRGITGDDAVARAVDRLLLRRRAAAAGPTDPGR